jgi:hypothetical protein
MRACIRDEKGQFVAATTMYVDAIMISAEGCMGISTSNEVDGDARTSQTDL